MNEFCAVESIIIAKVNVIMAQTYTSKHQPKGKFGKENKTKLLGKLIALGDAKIGNQSRKVLPKGKCFHCGLSKKLSKTFD